MYKLLIVGFGNVGQGLAKLLIEKGDILQKEQDFEYKVVGIVDKLKGTVVNSTGIDLRKALALAESGSSLSTYPEGTTDEDPLTVIRDIRADVLLEATYTDIQTGEPATSYIREALKSGKHVITTNKGPLALHSRELLGLARQNNVKFLYEGTVMSGTPVLNLLRETLKGAYVSEISGILNGTTNYILTQMEEGLTYEAALKQAQDLGYAEASPEADVEGYDALAKVAILSNVVFGTDLKPADIPCEGITRLTAEQINDAKKENKRFKLLASIKRENGTVTAEVGPQKIAAEHPLASVSGATNAITITTDSLGCITVNGPGAGRVETGYSMLIDLLSLRNTN